MTKANHAGVKTQRVRDLTPAHVISPHAFYSREGLTGGCCQSGCCVALGRRQRSLSARNGRLIAGSHSGCQVRLCL
jgi:hypothetical protein